MKPHPLMLSLRRERERQKLSAQQIADRSGYHVQTVRKAETGEINPTLVMVECYAAVLDIDIGLFRRVPAPGHSPLMPPAEAVECPTPGCWGNYQIRANGQMRKHRCKPSRKERTRNGKPGNV